MDTPTSGKLPYHGPKLPRFKVDMAQVRWLLRATLVSTTEQEIRKDAELRARRARWYGRKLTPGQQRKVVDAFLRVHRENQLFYTRVMGGALCTTRPMKTGACSS